VFEQHLTANFILSVLIAVAASVAWIELRFRQTRADFEEKLATGAATSARSVEATTTEHRQAAARLDRQAASIMKDLAQVQLSIAHDLRNYPTKADIQAMLEPIGDQIDKLEHRIENLMGVPRRTP
jgi:hypothetical protein